ncbi:MAG TPA: PhoH family protein [Candidatus Omnitrophota bacterium]|nr:PhoH family protein [Candidatus Omnitrophota bacterium]HRY85076.1 PhoH family protein [Candidatus Omnitrophota bacterium]
MQKIIKLHSNEEARALYGNLDQNIRQAEKDHRVKIVARNDRLKIMGDKKNVEDAHRFFVRLLEMQRKGGKLIERSPAETGSKKETHVAPPHSGGIHFFHRGKVIQARSENQLAYLKAMQARDIVIAIGPAGTGKTYLAMAAAVEALKKKYVARIILTRPAVEAGENLGFLPGDLAAKVNPYLRPLYDALYDMLEFDEVARYTERGAIEIAPIAYMRGRTLNDSYVILDEAQNCTHNQMKMFLTRLGQTSKVVITGDITQIDLPSPKKSGLVEIRSILADIPDIQFIYLNETDVVRHPLVQEIIKAYEKHERKRTQDES